MTIKFARYMTAADFARELQALRAYRGEHIDNRFLERLEEAGLVIPRTRIRYPDAVARRFWLERHEERKIKCSVEPDGDRWEAAVELANSLHRWANPAVYGPSVHPLDDPDPRFTEFIQRPAEVPFRPRLDTRADIASDLHSDLCDPINFESFYSTWQVFLAAETADIGVHFRVNLADETIGRSAQKAFDCGNHPSGWALFSLAPIRVARGFSRHQPALDAVVRFAEEKCRVLAGITKGRKGRVQLNPMESRQFDHDRHQAALDSHSRYEIGEDALIGLCRFLTERWAEWNHEGRPLIAEVYKAVLAEAIIMTRVLDGFSFSEIRGRIGQHGGGRKPILDVIWPDWTEEEKNRVRRTLRSWIAGSGEFEITREDLAGFVDFIVSNNLEVFFWRLRSFEEHALRGNEFAREGMRSDLQGMSIAVEHIVRVLAGKGDQPYGGKQELLYAMLKKLWSGTRVPELLKSGKITNLVRHSERSEDWHQFKIQIEELRQRGRLGSIAADLVIAGRIRGGVHTILPENDHFELERLFLSVMRAAASTFAHVCHRQVPPSDRSPVRGPL